MEDLFPDDHRRLTLEPGAVLLRGFALPVDRLLLDAVAAIAEAASFRHLETPGGRRMSVAMTNAGGLGWLSDQRGYRYEAADPLTGRAWPSMPSAFAELAREAATSAGFDGFSPEACLSTAMCRVRSCRSTRTATSATSISPSSPCRSA